MSRAPSLLHQVPATVGRGKVWATRCADCGAEVHMGPGSKAAMVCLIEAAGRYCDACRSAAAAGVFSEGATND